MTKRLFLTGGSGFIGTEVTDLALERGWDIRNIDLVRPETPQHVPFWREGDIRNAEALAAMVREYQPHYLLHLASDTDVALTTLDQFTTTIDGTRNVLRAVAACPGIEKFIHTSTQYVVLPGAPVRGERIYEPHTTYGEAKAETERMVWDANLSAPWLIVRPTIVWGPRHPSYPQNIWRHIATGAYLHPSASKPIMRAYGYVTNTAEQMVKLLAASPEETTRHVYYLGDGSLSYDAWADAFSRPLVGRRARRIPASLLKVMGKVGDMVSAIGIKSPIDSGRAFRMTTSSTVDLEPVLAITGTPSVGFEQGVARTLAWLRGVDGELFGGAKKAT